jgi:hypothetical protein
MMRATDEKPEPKKRFLELTIPFHFSTAARASRRNLEVGDFVRLRGLDGEDDKYELVSIHRRRNSVRVKRIGSTDQLYLPWWHVKPWNEVQKDGA